MSNVDKQNPRSKTLDAVAVDGKIYSLPGFSDIFGIIYDRTLFEENGWELPDSRDSASTQISDWKGLKTPKSSF